MRDEATFRDLTVRPGHDPASPLPPRVRAWPVVGSTIPFLRDPQRYLLAAYRSHGSVFRIRLGPQDYVVISGPEGSAFATREGRRFLTVEGVWTDISRITGADPHAIVTNVDGERHTELRGIFRAGMSRSAAFETLDRSLVLAEDALGRAARRGRPVDAVAFSRLLVFEQLGHTMSGNAPPAMFDAASEVLRAIVARTRVPALRRLPLSASLKRAAKDAADLSTDILASRTSRDSTFVRDLLEGLRTGAYAESDLSAFMLAPFVAGLDTMAHTLAFVLFRLVQHPEWAARLRDEVDRAVATSGALDDEAIDRCPELGFFVQEVMRIHPLSPGVLRLAREDFVLDGFRIPRGTWIMLPHTLPHLMREFFPDPERFDPLRFHPDRAEHRGAGRYAPFGIGAHVCLGAGTAEVLLRANAAAALRHVDFAGADPGYVLRVSNTSGACPVGFDVRLSARASMRAAA